MRSKNSIDYKPHLRAYARALRKNGTLGEVLLWKSLKKKALGFEFHRQVPIDTYIVDFFCHELRLAIEVDGCGHAHPNSCAEDVRRQAALESLGIHFLRFSEQDVRGDLDNVVRTVRDWIEGRI